MAPLAAGPQRGLACIVALLAAGAGAAAACSGDTGVPAAPAVLEVLAYDAGRDASAPIEASVPVPVVTLSGFVRGVADAGVAGALVVVEVGGLDQTAAASLGADGGLQSTLNVDLFVRYGGLTDSTGAFTFAVPAGQVGLHTFALPYREDQRTVQTATLPDATVPPAIITLLPLALAGGASDAASVEAGVVGRPTATDLTVSPLVVSPLAAITFAVALAAGSVDDPLSEEAFLVEPTTQWAGALAPATPAVPHGPYPDGVYSRLVEAPGTPGTYTYTVVVASMKGVPSVPASVVVTVTPTGAPPLPDAGSPDAPFFVEGGGLPDGRR